jgi:hypothetical protein
VLLDVLFARQPDQQQQQQLDRRVLHVQSISSWAPSCIGPYSQVGFALPLLQQLHMVNRKMSVLYNDTTQHLVLMLACWSELSYKCWILVP